MQTVTREPTESEWPVSLNRVLLVIITLLFHVALPNAAKAQHYDGVVNVLDERPGDIYIGKVDGSSRNVIIRSVGGSVTMQKIDGSSNNILVEAEKNVTLTERIDGTSKNIVIRAKNGYIHIHERIDGSSEVTLEAPNGGIFIGEKIDGESVVHWCAKELKTVIRSPWVNRYHHCHPKPDTPDTPDTPDKQVDIAPRLAKDASVYGRVTFVGTLAELKMAKNAYNAQFRFRLSSSTCDMHDGEGRKGDGKDVRWFLAQSGVMTGPYVHNMANTLNAYNTVLTAFLSRSGVQVDGVPDCNTREAQTLRLWRTDIGLLPKVPAPVKTDPAGE
jgi:hypothetical protein